MNCDVTVPFVLDEFCCTSCRYLAYNCESAGRNKYLDPSYSVQKSPSPTDIAAIQAKVESDVQYYTVGAERLLFLFRGEAEERIDRAWVKATFIQCSPGIIQESGRFGLSIDSAK